MIKYFQTKAQYENKKSSFVKDGDLVFIKDTKDIIFNGVSFADTIREFSYGVRNIQLGDSINQALSCDYALKSYMNVYSGAARELLYGDRNTTGDVTNNANGFIVLNRHYGSYNSVLFFTPTRIYYAQGDTFSDLSQTKGKYKKIAFTDDLNDYLTTSEASSLYMPLKPLSITLSGSIDTGKLYINSVLFASNTALGIYNNVWLSPEESNREVKYWLELEKDTVAGTLRISTGCKMDFTKLANFLNVVVFGNGSEIQATNNSRTLTISGDVSILPSNNTGGRLVIKSKGSNYKQYIASSTTATSELTFTLPNVAGELATVEKVNSLGYMTRSTADSLYLTKSTADGVYMPLKPSSITTNLNISLTFPTATGRLATILEVLNLGYMSKSTADGYYIPLNPSAITLKSGNNSIKFLVNDSGEFSVDGKIKSSGIISSAGLSVTGSSSLGQLAAGATLLSSLNVLTTSTFLKDATFNSAAIIEGNLKVLGDTTAKNITAQNVSVSDINSTGYVLFDGYVTFNKLTTHAGALTVNGEVNFKGDYTKTGNLWLTYGNLFNLSGDNANNNLVINYSCWKQGVGNVLKSTHICDGLNNTIAAFTPTSVECRKPLTVNGSITATSLNVSSFSISTLTATNALLNNLKVETTMSADGAINTNKFYLINSTRVLQMSGSDVYISESSSPSNSYWLKFTTYSGGGRQTLLSGDLNIIGEIYSTNQHVNGLIYAADTNNTLGIRGKTVIKDYEGKNQIAYFSGSLVQLSSNNTVKLIVSQGSVECTDTLYATNMRIKDTSAEPYMYIYNSGATGYSKLTSNNLRPLNNTFNIDGTLSVNNLNVNDQLAVNGGFVANSWAVMNGLEVTNLTLKNDMTVGGALYTGSIGMKTGNLFNNWFSDEMVINFDGLGNNKITSICDGKYNKIATFAPSLITFNQKLTAQEVEAKYIKCDNIEGKIEKSYADLDVSLSTIKFKGKTYSNRGTAKLSQSYLKITINMDLTSEYRYFYLELDDDYFKTGDTIDVIIENFGASGKFNLGLKAYGDDIAILGLSYSGALGELYMHYPAQKGLTYLRFFYDDHLVGGKAQIPLVVQNMYSAYN